MENKRYDYSTISDPTVLHKIIQAKQDSIAFLDSRIEKQNARYKTYYQWHQDLKERNKNLLEENNRLRKQLIALQRSIENEEQ